MLHVVLSCLSILSVLYSERVLQDGLYYEFCRYSSQAIVRMYGEASEKKWAVVKYKK